MLGGSSASRGTLARHARRAFALVGAAAMIGASMQAPLAGLVLVLELTHSGFGS